MRVTAANSAPLRPRRAYVLYWMIAARRTAWSFALDRAIAHAVELGRPLVVVEPLRCDYPWASDRLHAFVMRGMADNAAAFAAAGVTYLPYVEPAVGAGRGLLAALARRACVVVTDEQPGFFLPRMVAAAAAQLDVRVEQVDGAGVLPLRAAPDAFATAMAFRRHLQRTVAPYLVERPAARPLARAGLGGGEIAGSVLRRWPSARGYAELSIDHDVPPVAYPGGAIEAARVARRFVRDRLPRYAERSHPDAEVASGLSPYLHFGHIGVHDVLSQLVRACDWDPSRLGTRVTGKKEGWWGLPAEAEAFVDELVTWRELGAGFCFYRRDYDRYASLPPWARATLDEHARDPRPVTYTRAQLAAAETHDEIWNAAQRELVVDGRIHNYLRMLWGKKILEWSPSPRAALATLIELNNRYAVDGRDPNSYSGICWTLGRFDRPWGPERPIFGLIRYMSSDATRRKLDLERYVVRWAASGKET
jgi:deoxyribodipyrimidine photo-lyase